jgi:hypothetical protein
MNKSTLMGGSMPPSSFTRIDIDIVLSLGSNSLPRLDSDARVFPSLPPCPAPPVLLEGTEDDLVFCERNVPSIQKRFCKVK